MNRFLCRGPVLAAATSVFVLASCGKTTVVEVTTVPTTIEVGVTTTMLSGTPAELLPQLRDTAFRLSPAMIEGKGKQVMADLDRLWASISSQLPRTEFVDDAAHQLDLMRVGVERKRAADVDKAALHLQAIVDSELPKLSGS